MLRDYQETLIGAIHDAWNEQPGHVIAVAPCGAGKTVMMAHQAKHCGVENVSIAHRRELIWQMSAAFAQAGIYHRIIAPQTVINSVCAMHIEKFGQRFYRADSDVGIASVDAMIKRTGDPFFEACRQWQTDECFPAGTLIDGVPIECIAPGDEVWAFNEASQSLERRKVVRLFRNPIPDIMVRLQTCHGKIECTMNHPFFTKGGWRTAYELYCLWEFNSEQPKDMLGQVQTGPFFANDERNKQKTLLCTNESKQPHESRGGERENASKYSGVRSSPKQEGRQWSRIAGTGTGSFGDVSALWICVSTRHCHKSKDAATYNFSRSECPEGKENNTLSLQAGYGESRINDRCRSGREYTFRQTEGDGRKAGHYLDFVRLESAEIYQSGNSGNSGDGFVYNFEVDGLHTYTANGFVVHNCHHLQPDNKWGRAAAMCKNARGLGWSATPKRSDRRPLKSVFGKMVIGPSVRDLINRGYLADYRIYGLPQAIDVSNVRIGANGEFNQGDLSAAARAQPMIVGDVVQTYLKYARGLSGVTFAVDVTLAEEHAQAFRDAGVSAAVLEANTKDSARTEIIRAYRNKELDQICNVDILGEGFDCPGIQVVSKARPSMSEALCIQQMMRPMRPDGDKIALILDHVGNVVRHGLPDTLRPWSLDEPDRKKGVARLEVVIRVCPACLQPYEGFEPVCPFCGAERERGERNRPEALEGDLTLYTPELLAHLRGEVERISGPEQIPYGMDDNAAAGLVKQWNARQDAQAQLADAIDHWAGFWVARGDSIRAAYARFYNTFGMDTLQALAQPGPKMRLMKEKVETHR